MEVFAELSAIAGPVAYTLAGYFILLALALCWSITR